jgi:NIPSNAP
MYLHVELKVRYGRIERFGEIFARMLPALERNGWELVGGYQSLIGNYTTVIHLWRIDDPNHHPRAIQAAFEDEAFASGIAELADIVTDETTQVMIPTAYSPA